MCLKSKWPKRCSSCLWPVFCGALGEPLFLYTRVSVCLCQSQRQTDLLGPVLYVQPVMCVERTGQEMVHGPRIFSEDNIPPTIFQHLWFMVQDSFLQIKFHQPFFNIFGLWSKVFFYSQHSTTYFSIFLVYGPRFYSTDNIPPTAFQYFWFMVQDSFLQITFHQPFFNIFGLWSKIIFYR